MTATIDMFESRSLTNAINKTAKVEPFILKTLFGNTQFHAAEKIDIEIISGSERLAQFVNANESAIPIKKNARKVKTLTVPRTFEKKVFTALELANYKTLGSIYGASAAEIASRANEMVLKELDELKERILRRREQLACEALSTGKISVVQDNIEIEADYDFVTDVNLVTLATAKKWSATGINPLADLRTWKRNIMRRTGKNADLLILGSDAADAFLANAEVLKQLDNNNYRVGAVDLTQNATTSGIFIGRLLGVDIYEYNQQYINSSGVTADMIDAKKAILTAKSSDGFRVHVGPMYRIENGNLKMYQEEFLVESYTNDEKTALDWKVEQKSLPAIHDPDAVISATVV